jgi:GT2 family glycosyltransferase
VTGADVTVVIPTLGRIERLRACLESLAACEPPPAEVLLVAQDRVDEVRDLLASFPTLPAGVVACEGRGVSRSRNAGLRAARHRLVLVTDDDCTVASDWVAVATRLAAEAPGAIVTGRVLPAGDPRFVPSVKDDPEPHDFTGETHGGALFPNNMVVDRDAVLAAGGFDERFGPAEAAEDNEFCYRWLRAGHALHYRPELLVWHHDWRTPEALDRLYVAYARGQGFFYAKHLRRGDMTMLRYLARDLWWAGRGVAAAVVRRRPSWTDPRRGILRGLPAGLRRGWRAYGPTRPSA